MTREITIGVDVGGTFTDVALVADGTLTTAKVPTTENQSAGVLNSIEKACKSADRAPETIDAFVHAMTVSVNALLERDGAKTALVTTAGFRDVLEIGRQDRPALYDLTATKPTPLVPRRRRFEIDERATPNGIVEPVTPAAVRSIAEDIAATDAESVAVCLLHAYATPKNEQTVARILREELDIPVSVSHEVLAEFREFERTATTAADAYVTPAIEGYLGRVQDQAVAAGIPEPRIMQANGGTASISAVRDRPITTVLSGPAAGVVGAAAAADEDTVVTFDMGGTSTDVSLVRDGDVERTTDATVGEVPIQTPMVDVNTVGAGGGSIAWVDAGGAVRVGPESAGADPGPACYDRGGTAPTVTDAAAVLGYLGTDIALGGEVTIDREAARTALETLATTAGLADATAAAEGVHRVATATMARAIRGVTVERGYDPRQFALVAFGGAGPMHAAAVADRLDIDQVLIPGPAGVLSAYGLLAADEVHDAGRTVQTRLEEATPEQMAEIYADLEAEVREATTASARVQVDRAVDCRYAGQSFELTVPIETFTSSTVADRFHALHETTHGYTLEAPIEIVTLRVTATRPQKRPPIDATADDRTPKTGVREVVFSERGPRETTIYDRAALDRGRTVTGPAILEKTDSTTVIPPDWNGTVTANGSVRLEVTS